MKKIAVNRKSCAKIHVNNIPRDYQCPITTSLTSRERITLGSGNRQFENKKRELLGSYRQEGVTQSTSFLFNNSRLRIPPAVTRSTVRADVGVAIVPQTISRHLAEANLKSKRPFRALPLTPEHRQLRLQWFQARSIWNVTDWQKVVFSDEFRIVLGTDDNHIRVWRRPGERYNFPTLFYVTLPAQLV
ncbi:transposable element Tcb2 transposase [Trichonephila clavipes]|uniref:Transposable element Tcb2 transposase n=1 Tax=Trichonephila clavipes TaxID=2585209 RepID=A0A8X6VUZ5_TRICX|nr:transposable element Tcb2 transposase [Trichonephila clavipes]